MTAYGGNLIANPTGETVIFGGIEMTQQGSSLIIQQTTDRAVIHWQDFSIGHGEMTQFIQPSSTSAVLNRVVGDNLSAIHGTLQANGQVFLINPHGIIVGSTGVINTAGFTASTLDVADSEFLQGGDMRFFTSGNGPAGEIINLGKISALEGDVVLIARQVTNEGEIHAPNGMAALAAGSEVLVKASGEERVFVQPATDGHDGKVDNKGAIQAAAAELKAAGGNEYALAINNSGTVRATGVERRGGRVFLSAGGKGGISNSGKLVARKSDGSGGAVRIKAGGSVSNEATLDVATTPGAPDTTGGDVSIEGGSVALGGLITADGPSGGSIAIRSAGALSLADQLSAQGTGGAGGAIQISAGGRIIENSGSSVNASGTSAGGSIRAESATTYGTSGSYAAAASAGLGGRIDLTAQELNLFSAKLDASGALGGGLVRLGGAFQGGKAVEPGALGDLFVNRFTGLAVPELAAASKTLVNDGARIDVSSTHGEGGALVVWSEELTTFVGQVAAGGSLGVGNGGGVEISSRETLRHTDLGSIVGARTLLLDPKNIVVGNAAQAQGWSYQAILGFGYSKGVNMGSSSGVTLESYDYFGQSVSLNAAGDRLAVGAFADAGSGNALNNSGAVYLFSFTDTSFSGGSLQSTIGHGYTGGKNLNLSGTLGSDDFFGQSVSLNAAGDRLAVGAHTDDGSGNGLGDSGAVYLFSFTDTSFSGGSLQSTIGHGYTGGKNLNLSGTLGSSDFFGISVSLNAAGDRLAVGAYGDAGSGNALDGSGAVYLFSFTDTSFSGGSLQSTIGHGYTGGKNLNLTGTLDTSDFFGGSVSLNAAGDRLAVGAIVDAGSGNALSDSGAVYLFSFTDTSFSGGSLQSTIGHGYTGGKNLNLSGTLGSSDNFGQSVSLNAAGDRLAVGAYGDAGSGNALAGSGAVYLFSFTDTSFSGGSLQSTIGHGYTGGKNLNLSGTLGSDDFFGISVSLNAAGDRLAVGAFGDAGSGNALPQSGAVYLFSFTDTSFSGGSLQSRIGHGYSGGKNLNLSGTLNISDYFGYSVSLNAAGDRLAVGAVGDDGSGNALFDSGAVHLFSFTDTNFSGGSLQSTIGHGYTGGKNLDLSSVLGSFDGFGTGVSLNAAGDRLAVGASQDDGIGNALGDSGAVYLISFTDTSFSGGSLQGTIGHGYTGGKNLNLTGTLGSNDRFGISVSLNAAGDRLAVGAYGDDGSGNALNSSGAVYLFSFTDTSFSGGSLQSTIGHGYTGGKNLDLTGTLNAGDQFGFSVALNAAGDRLAAGAHLDDGAGNALDSSGAVHLFSFTDTSFSGGSLQSTLGHGYTGGKNLNLVGTLNISDYFGYSVSLNAAGDRLAVGVLLDDGSGNTLVNVGAVHLFSFTDTSFSGGSLQSTLGHGYTGGKNLDLFGTLNADDYFGTSVSLNAVGDRLAVGAYLDDGAGNALFDSGAVYLFSIEDAATALTFAGLPDQNVTLTAATITAITNTGTAVILQANNDITINAAIVSNNGSGNGGAITLQAGRSILINADITTDNGALTLVANEALANGVVDAHRDSGNAVITMAAGTSINAGTGAVSITLADGAGKTYSASGDITLWDITAGMLTVANLGPTAGSGISLLSNGSILLNNGSSLLTQGGAIILNSDRDADGTGRIRLTNTTITSNGGDILLSGGGGDLNALRTTGFARATSAGGYGIELAGASTILNSGAGNTTLRGASGSAGGSVGVYIYTGAQVNAGAGDIRIVGQVVSGDGLQFSTNSSLTTAGGDITLTGTATGTAATSAELYRGVVIVNNFQINANGGSILVQGTGGANSTLANQGIVLWMGVGITTSGTGSVTLEGATLDAAAESVLVSNSSTITSGTLGVSIDALTGNNGTILVDGGAAILSNGGQTHLRANRNIVFNNGSVTSGGGAVILNSNHDAVGTGSIRLVNSTVQSNDGSITFGGGADPSASSAVGIGSGSELIVDSGDRQYGILLHGSTVGSGAGAIEIRGEGFTSGSNNIGVRVQGGSSVSSTSGNIVIVGLGGTAGGAGNGNIGFYLQDASITSASGAIDVTGTAQAGSGAFNFGLGMEGKDGTALISNSTGSITLNGTGSGSEANAFGVLLSNRVDILATGVANIQINATAGSGASVDLQSDNPTNSTRIGGPSANGNITLNANTLEWSSNVSLQSTGTLLIQPRTTATTIGIGTGAAGTLALDAEILSSFQDGFSEIIIGNATAGNITTTAATIADNLRLITGGDLGISGALNLGSNRLALIVEGGTTQTGAITAGSLRLGGNGNFTLENAANSVGTIAKNGSGSASLRTAGALAVGSVDGVDGVAGSTVHLRTGGTGNLTLNQAVVATSAGTAVILATPANFINNVGAAAVSASNGRWLVFSNSPVGNTFGALLSGNQALWNIADSTTSITPTGNRYIFAQQPTLTFTSTGESKQYGADLTAAIADNFTTGGFIDAAIHGDVFTQDTLANTTSGSAVASSAGAAVTATVAGSPYDVLIDITGVSATTGYALAKTESGQVTVTQKALTITANGQSKVYGDTFTFAGTEFSTDGLINGDSVTSATLDSTGAVATATVAGGPYTITISNAAGTGLGNYAISYVNGSMNVTARPITLTPDSGQSKVYGAVDPVLTYSLTSGDLVNGDTLSGALTRAAGETVSNYAINQGTLAASGNYAVTFTGGVNFAITPKALTITANGQSKTYGDTFSFAGTEFSTDGLINGDAVTSVDLSSTGTVATASVSGSPYAITASNAAGTGLSNYAISYVNGSLNVTARPITLTPNASQSKVYGNVDSTLTYSITSGDLVNGDTLSGALARTAGETVGDYAINQGTLNASGNYAVTFTSGVNFAITAKALTITANGQSKTYGDTFTFAGTEFSTDGLINGDSVTSAALGSTGAVATATVSGSPYTITASNAAGTGLSNYNISYVNGSMNVTARPITLTPDSGQSKVYGAVDPVLAYSLTSGDLVNGDTLSGALSRAAGETVGDYAINQGTLSASGNYAVTFTSGVNFAITPKDLTVAANNASRTTLEPDPAFSATFTGFVPGEGPGDLLGTLTFTTPATPGSAPGDYTITPAGLTSSNYAISFVNGILTVTQGVPQDGIALTLLDYDNSHDRNDRLMQWLNSLLQPFVLTGNEPPRLLFTPPPPTSPGILLHLNGSDVEDGE